MANRVNLTRAFGDKKYPFASLEARWLSPSAGSNPVRRPTSICTVFAPYTKRVLDTAILPGASLLLPSHKSLPLGGADTINNT